MRFRDAGKWIDTRIDKLRDKLGLIQPPPANPPAPERFNRWFTAPTKVLSEELKYGDGAFVVMGIGFFLCERYFRSMTGHPDNWQDQSFKKLAATHFDVNEDFFDDFWNIYRNGIQHQGSPKRGMLTKKLPGNVTKPGWPIDYKWKIGSFDSMPQKWLNGGFTYICIDPFGFTRRMIELWEADEPRMAEMTAHRLAEITNGPPIFPTSVKHGDAYP